MLIILYNRELLEEYNDTELYKKMSDDRWDFLEDKPIENASRYTQLQRRIVNGDPSRVRKLKEIIELT